MRESRIGMRFLDNCIIELDNSKFEKHFENISYWGKQLDRYTQRYVTENHVKANPKMAPYLNKPVGHYDFGVKEGTTKIPELMEVTRVLKKEVKIGTINFLYFPPGIKLGKHIDPPARESLLIIPITPLDDYSSPVFYDKDNNEYSYYTLNPHIINTQITHSLHNTSDKGRINFQLGLKHSMDEIKEMLVKEEFFA